MQSPRRSLPRLNTCSSLCCYLSGSATKPLFIDTHAMLNSSHRGTAPLCTQGSFCLKPAIFEGLTRPLASQHPFPSTGSTSSTVADNHLHFVSLEDRAVKGFRGFWIPRICAWPQGEADIEHTKHSCGAVAPRGVG